jgi:hypothetical protein
MKDQITTLYTVMQPASSTDLVAKGSSDTTSKTLVTAA